MRRMSRSKEGRNDDFKILLLSGKTADPTAHKAARDHAPEITKGIKAKIDHDQQGNGDDGCYTRYDSYKKMSSMSLHQGLDSWDQNDSFLNLNDHASKRPFFNIGSKIPHKFANLVLICESQSNQRRPNLTWDLCFAFIDQMVLVNNLLQVIDLVIHIHEFGV
jgi:hypothetical protein